MSVSGSGCVSVCIPDTNLRAYEPSEGREVGKGIKEDPGRSDAMLGDGVCLQLMCAVRVWCGVEPTSGACVCPALLIIDVDALGVCVRVLVFVSSSA